LVGLADGLIWAGSGNNNGTVSGIRVVRVNGTGSIVWDSHIPGGSMSVNQAISWQQGFLVIGGTGSEVEGFARSYNLDGVASWTATYPGEPSGVVATAEGFVMVGERRVDSIRYLWLAQADSAGKLIWSRTLPQKYAGGAALVSVGGGWVATGWINSATAGNGQDFWLVRTDLLGNPLWNRSYGDTKENRAGAVLALGDGFLVGGPELIRTDAFGNATCSSSGGCVELDAGSCQDGNPCTGDDCSAAKAGCNYPAWEDGLSCGTGNVCKAGVCGP